MADISQLEVNGTTYNICDATARDSLSNYVLKTGDTMTGDLLVDNYRVKTLSSSIERGNPGSGTIYGGGTGFQVCDKDGTQIGYIQPVQYSNGRETMEIGVSNYVNGETTDYIVFETGFEANGDPYYHIGKVQAFRNAIGFGTTAPGTVLWNDYAYMIEAQTADLSANISTCPTGVVLHWQKYADGAVQNYDHNYQFIPKTHVATANGAGIAHLLTTSTGTIGRKYVYVYDNKIVGNFNNTVIGTESGITFNNKTWVLTQVIAV